MKDKIIGILIGLIFSVLGYVFTDSIGLVKGNVKEIDTSRTKLQDMAYNSKIELEKRSLQFMEEMKIMQTALDSKLSTLQLEIAKQGGDFRAMRVSIDSSNKNTEKDLNLLNSKVDKFIVMCTKKIEVFEERLRSNEIRVTNIEMFLKNNYKKKRGLEFFNLNI